MKIDQKTNQLATAKNENPEHKDIRPWGIAGVDKFFKEGSAKIVLDALVKNKCKN